MTSNQVEFISIESMSPQMQATLRAELKRNHFRKREAFFGEDLKYYWKSQYWMFEIDSLVLPDGALSPWNLRQFCNKPTML